MSKSKTFRIILRLFLGYNKSYKHDLFTILYLRLSREDDNHEGESNSIENQDEICQGVFLHKSTFSK